MVPYQLHGLEGDNGQLTAVTVATLEGETKRIEADILLPFFGLSMSLGPIADWGLTLERNQIEVDPATTATSKAGIFGVGDVVTYPGKLKLILTGFAEAAIAARSAYALIHPETPLRFEYSTTSGVPDRHKVYVDVFCPDHDLGYEQSQNAVRPGREASAGRRPIASHTCRWSRPTTLTSSVAGRRELLHGTIRTYFLAGPADPTGCAGKIRRLSGAAKANSGESALRAQDRLGSPA